MASESRADTAPNHRWLSIVGIGEDGLDGLGPNALRHIREAEFVFGGQRHIALARSAISGTAKPWPTPFDSTMSDVLAHRGRKVCVLASGDPFLHGVGATLARNVAAAEMIVLPAPSSFSLAAARLGWALQDIETTSLHGRSINLIRPLLHAGRKILALTSDENGPKALATLLVDAGFGDSRVTVLEALGGGNERLRSTTAADFSLADIHPLNVVAIEMIASVAARHLPLSSGLADDLFEHDGQITKHEIRALTLAALAPLRGQLLWDIGAGAGSISVEWMLSDPSMRAIAIEADPVRAARIARNASALGVPDLVIIEGTAPAALAGLETPDAIFIGGGGSEPGVIEAAIGALGTHGRLVANAVTLEMEAVLLARHAAMGGNLTRIAIARTTEVGSMTGWRPAMPVTQWAWTKP